MPAFGCNFGQLAYNMNRAKQHREAVEAIRELGGAA
jgi:hypothetical protein